MFRFLGQTLFIGFILGSSLFSYGLGFAANDENSLKFIAGYDYYHIRNDLPTVYKEQLDASSRILDLGLEFVTGNVNSQFSLSIDGKGNENDFKTNLKEFTWSGKQGKILYELGKTKWLWGRGLSFNPTCPLDMDTYYWGGQLSLLNSSQSLTMGAASDKKSYNSDTSDAVINGQASDKNYTGWVRSGWIFETSDLTTVASYQSAQDCWNYGLDFSRDLQNGFEVHGGINCKSSDSVAQYLVGGEYSAKYFYIAEFYHASDDVLILAISNETGMLGSFQWQFREIYNLTDSGEMRKINLKYTKNNHVVPELEVSMNVGPKTSYYRKNPIDYYVLFKVTTQF